MNCLERIINRIDPELRYVRVLGEGAYGTVAKVNLKDKEYALKIQQLRNLYPMDYEFGIQSELHGIEGIPEAIRLYDGAFLMQYIDGELMYEAYQKLGGLPQSFFDRGYSVPSDFGVTNIMVDRDINPWIIDFMYSQKITPEQKPDLVFKTNSNLKTFEYFYGKRAFEQGVRDWREEYKNRSALLKK